jgi:hypothetical protein
MLLEEEFLRIKENHRDAIIKRATRVVLGFTVKRGLFREGSKEHIAPLLNAIPYDDLPRLQNQEEFRYWFERHLNTIAEKVHLYNQGKTRIYPGYKWGHSAKILTLQLREIVLNSRYFSDETVEKISPWLYVPIDSIVIKRLKEVGVKPKFDFINQIDSAEKFYFVQDALTKSAISTGVPRVWFDDVWGTGNE